ILSPVAHITYIPPIPTRRSSDLERVLDRLAVHRENDVTGLHAGSGRRTVLARLRDQGATGPRQAEAVGDVGAHVLDADAEEAAGDAAALDQLAGHLLDDVGRDGEGDADIAAGGREDRGVHADHFALEVEGRAAGVAGVDRRKIG